MSKAREREPQEQAGWAVGKRVWLRTTFDGQRYAKQYGTSGLLSDPDMDGYLRRLVCFESGLVWIPEAHLRLSPPPSLSGKAAKTREAKPPKRKEAIRPDLGEETTIFDHLEA